MKTLWHKEFYNTCRLIFSERLNVKNEAKLGLDLRAKDPLSVKHPAANF